MKIGTSDMSEINDPQLSVDAGVFQENMDLFAVAAVPQRLAIAEALAGGSRMILARLGPPSASEQNARLVLELLDRAMGILPSDADAQTRAMFASIEERAETIRTGLDGVLRS